jgi:hypothetical protein
VADEAALHARREAASLVTRLRETEPEILALAGLDLGPALEQSLFGLLRHTDLAAPHARRPTRLGALMRLTMGLAGGLGAPRPAAGSVVAIGLSPAHPRILEPISDELVRRGTAEPFLVRAAKLDVVAAGRRFRGAGLSDLVDAEFVAPLIQHLRRLGRRLDGATRSWDEAWSPVSTEALRRGARDALARSGLEAACLLSIAARRPALMMSFNENGRWARLIPAAARRRGVLSLDVAHAEIVDAVAIQGADFDRFAVFGAYSASTLQEAGMDPGRVVQIGAPRFDQLIRRARKGDGRPERTIVVASQWLGGRMTAPVKRAMLEMIFEAASSVAPVQVVVRLHPLEVDSTVQETVASLPPQAGVASRVERDGDLYEALDGAWAMVTGWSNAVFEAALLGVPSICVNTTGGPLPLDLAGGIASEAGTAGQLTSRLGQLLDDRERGRALAAARDGLLPRLGPLDGHAAERAADLILEMIRG